MNLSEMTEQFNEVRRAYPELNHKIARLHEVAFQAVHSENARGGEARQVVADVARILGTDIDTGPGHRWDADHMRRVVRRAEWLRDDRDHWESIAGALEFERDELAAEKVKLTDLLRGEKERANAAIEREETADEAAEDLRSYAAKVERERDNYKRACESKPATMRLEGPGADALAARIDDIDELRATIVSQAREIARLKGESA